MPIRILLADDAHEMRNLVALSLRLNGSFEVVGEAANGREAVRMAGDLLPEVVLLDLSMPVMDGLEALPRILEASPKTVVVVFSGFDEVQLGREARKLGAAAYLEKGVPLDQLARTLTQVYAERVEAAP
ncbi:MAG TPA: response regulator transcription factor [Mycobacteriales bacterium]|nr:response regulator transcription factor [Mycobacteriales bacterium]